MPADTGNQGVGDQGIKNSIGKLWIGRPRQGVKHLLLTESPLQCELEVNLKPLRVQDAELL